MAMSHHERSSKPLHNFSLPCLKWGNQRLLRCVKITNNHHNYHHGSSSSLIPNEFQSKPTNFFTSNSNKTIPVDEIQGSAKRLKLSGLQEEGNNNGDPARPWNLRTRRAACRAPLKIEEKRIINIDYSPRRNNNLDVMIEYSPRKNESFLIKKKQCGEKVKFSVSLLKEEIEEDFMEMLRIRPPRRPKKRPRIVQKYLDSIFPGLWLTEVTPDSYKVPEVPES